MPKFVLSGDRTQAIRVVVEAATREAAIEAAEAGDYKVWDGPHDSAFTFDGDPDEHIEEVDDE